MPHQPLHLFFLLGYSAAAAIIFDIALAQQPAK
jgi:hypothetical protein